MLKNKKFILNTLALVLSFVLCFSALTFDVFAASLGTLNVWYSNSNNIGEWQYVPSYLYCVNLCQYGKDDIPLYDCGSTATTQWNNALGISISPKSSETASSLTAYAGRVSDINQLAIWYYTEDTAPAGVSSSSESLIGTWTYASDGSSKSGYKITFSRFAVFYSSGRSTAMYKHVATHELGHSLGYRGHSTSSYDVMYTTYNGVTTLTDRDRSHLRQVYQQ